VTSRKITVRAIFNAAGEPIRFLYQNGGGKSYFMDCEPSKDSSIDEFFMELMPPIADGQPAQKLQVVLADRTD
jgi:hypothetical protein